MITKLHAIAIVECKLSTRKHFSLYKGASGVELSALWSDVYDRVVPCMSAASVSTLGTVLTDAMVADVLPGFAQSVSAELAAVQQGLLRDGLSFQDRRRVQCIADVTGHDWARCLLFPNVFLMMVMLLRPSDALLVYVLLLCRISPLFVSMGSPESVAGYAV